VLLQKLSSGLLIIIQISKKITILQAKIQKTANKLNEEVVVVAKGVFQYFGGSCVGSSFIAVMLFLSVK
jgi:hypothetical protein